MKTKVIETLKAVYHAMPMEFWELVILALMILLFIAMVGVASLFFGDDENHEEEESK